MEIIRFHSSTLISVRSPIHAIPALLMSTSRPEPDISIRSKIRLTSDGTPTSPGRISQEPEVSFVIKSAVSCNSLMDLRQFKNTCHPSFAKWIAQAFPIPREAPVTRICFLFIYKNSFLLFISITLQLFFLHNQTILYTDFLVI